ncbi:serine protease 1-like [Periplaneta americana]|uniref:serine protease 1-like n=1 Tax=Periplaneta americana TaxID=6978 RepID=UPI0037E8A240
MDSRLLLIFSLLQITCSVSVITEEENSTSISTISTTSISTTSTTPATTTPMNGGDQAGETDFPYQVFIMGTGLCGGVIVSQDYILTAAHCVFAAGMDISDIKIVSGDKNLLTVGSYRSITYATEVKVHESYNHFNKLNDIAVVKVNDRYNLDGKHTSALEISDKMASGANCLLTGWGSLYQGKPIFFDGLQSANMTLLEKELCEDANKKLSDGQFCVGYSEDQRRSCLGDAGGPLVCDTNLTGITWGPVGCDDAGLTDPAFFTDVSLFAGSMNVSSPAVFTDVSFYKEWITKQISSSATIVPCLTTLLIMLFVALK